MTLLTAKSGIFDKTGWIVAISGSYLHIIITSLVETRTKSALL